MVVAQAQPVPVPSPYALPVEVGRTMARDEAPLVFRVLFDERGRNQVTTTVIRGAPVLQEVFAIRNEHGEIDRCAAQRDAGDRARAAAQARTPRSDALSRGRAS